MKKLTKVEFVMKSEKVHGIGINDADLLRRAGSLWN